jgi:hypothetical protein
MYRAALVLALVISLSGTVRVRAAGDDEQGTPTSSLAQNCPEYLAHLRAASTSLHQGDRSAALAELRQAKASLESCIRNSAEKGVAALDAASSIGA